MLNTKTFDKTQKEKNVHNVIYFTCHYFNASAKIIQKTALNIKECMITDFITFMQLLRFKLEGKFFKHRQ